MPVVFDLRIPSRERGNRGVCVGEEGSKDGEKAEKEDATAWDKL
jgi:hypothetical protein